MDEEQYINIEDGLSVGYIGGFDEEVYERLDVIEGKIEEFNSSLDDIKNDVNDHLLNHPSAPSISGRFECIPYVKKELYSSIDFTTLPQIVRLGLSRPSTIYVQDNNLIVENVKIESDYFYFDDGDIIQAPDYCEISLDMEFIADKADRRHAGIFIQRTGISTNKENGLRVGFLDNTICVSYFNQSKENDLTKETNLNSIIIEKPNLNEKLNLTVILKGHYLRIKYKDIVIYEDAYSIQTYFKLGLFNYGATVKFSNYHVNLIEDRWFVNL